MVAPIEYYTQMLADVVWKLLVLVIVLHVAGCSASSMIIEGPSNVTIAEGSNVTLKCRTSLDFTVEWLKSNYTLNLTNPIIKARYSIDKNNSLIIQNVRRVANVGLYECIVRNGSNVQERSQPAWVLVQFLEFIAHKVFLNRTLYIGETYTRYVASWTAFPKPRFSWQAPSSLLPSDSFTFVNVSTLVPSVMHYAGKITLTISNVNSSEYSGNYTVLADNGFQSRSTVVGILNVVDDCRRPVYWKCGNSKKCVLPSRKCDNLNNCGDWSDETNCSLPVPPCILSVHHTAYNGIELQWKLIKQKPDWQRVHNITTLVDLTVQGSTNNVRKTFAYNDGIDGLTWFRTIKGLQNDTTYTIVMRTKTHAGVSVNATSTNVTIPRMVAPSAPRNISISIRSRYLNIWLMVNYNRPLDEGGTEYLFGYLTKCLVADVAPPENNLYNCTKHLIELGDRNKGDFSFYSLNGDTKYYFAIYFRSEVKQHGQEASLFYTTPSLVPFTRIANDLSDAAIAGIVISCLVAFFFAVFGIYKAVQRTIPGSRTYATLYLKPTTVK